MKNTWLILVLSLAALASADPAPDSAAAKPAAPAGNPGFSHRIHVQREGLECSDCHAQVKKSQSLQDLRPVTAKTCEKCHEDRTFDPAQPIRLQDSAFRVSHLPVRGGLVFPHQAHLAAKLECAACHGKIPDSGHPAAAPAMPSMKQCMDCHMQKASVSCLACHTSTPKPLDHLAASWLTKEGHGRQANMDPGACDQCHEDKASCTACHMGADPRPVHDPNYRFTHGLDVKFKAKDCSACHAPLQRFCADCHEGKGRK